jgi:pimeloyl-ACP methyl ester carboxylesterase
MADNNALTQETKQRCARGATFDRKTAPDMADTVVLLHGIKRTSACMRKFEKHLQTQGYITRNVDYPSTRYPIERLAKIVAAEVEDAAQSNRGGRIHLVGHSMGGLVIRAMLKSYRPSNLGRVVMVGTPNNGSQVADFLKNVPLYKAAYGPAGQQLVSDQSTFGHIFGPVDFELGIIAGTRSIDPVSSLIIGYQKANDGKVTVESTRLAGAADHIVIAANHTFIPSNKTMWAQALSFLRDGRFHR